MKATSLLKPILLTSAGALFLAGCVVREPRYYQPPPPAVAVAPAPVEAEVVVSGPPPAPLLEVQPVAPGPDFIWIGGGWAWHGRWDWERGHWDRPPRRGAVWVAPRYVYRGGRHVYVRGGWR